ncbi:MAG: dihydrodipicolinate synthase family protein [Elusimicrobia bacterium RIFOXYD2_FULL_34_15]|nr:MAG: dihydrodipicolinate synthase family protein [Elusimicrobia bacterium RIFOXYD2_FULL_34_15]
MKKSNEILKLLKEGLVIPAHPLALNKNRKLNEKRQKALTRYYISAGAGGVAVGVHTTQFEIHEEKVGLYKPVLELASVTVNEFNRKLIKVAGICGKTKQAVSEANLANNLGYHAGLLSLSAFKNETTNEIIEHCKKVAEIIPIFGFYLQPSVGGRILDFNFWTRFLQIQNVIAIKMAPFNRYQTIDVVRAVAETNRTDIVLYTGNDDNIVNDLITTYEFKGKKIRIVGGLLGHWAFWTKKAVELLKETKRVKTSDKFIPSKLITKGIQITDSNSTVFDVANKFKGCIPGIHEILRRQGLLSGRWCLDKNLDLSPGQSKEIDRVYSSYPHLNDDEFVAEHLDSWLK